MLTGHAHDMESTCEVLPQRPGIGRIPEARRGSDEIDSPVIGSLPVLKQSPLARLSYAPQGRGQSPDVAKAARPLACRLHLCASGRLSCTPTQIMSGFGEVQLSRELQAAADALAKHGEAYGERPAVWMDITVD